MAVLPKMAATGPDMYDDNTISQAPPLDLILNQGNTKEIVEKEDEEGNKPDEFVMEHDDTESLMAENKALKAAATQLNMELETKHELVEEKQAGVTHSGKKT